MKQLGLLHEHSLPFYVHKILKYMYVLFISTVVYCSHVVMSEYDIHQVELFLISRSPVSLQTARGSGPDNEMQFCLTGFLVNIRTVRK